MTQTIKKNLQKVESKAHKLSKFIDKMTNTYLALPSCRLVWCVYLLVIFPERT